MGREYGARIQAAITRLSKCISGGELLAATDAAELLNAAAARLEELAPKTPAEPAPFTRRPCQAFAFNIAPAMFVYFAAESLMDACKLMSQRGGGEVLLSLQQCGSCSSGADWLNPVARMGGPRYLGTEESGGAGLSGERDFIVASIARSVFFELNP